MFIREKKKEVRILDSLCTTDYSTELMSGVSQTFDSTEQSAEIILLWNLEYSIW